MNGNSKSNAYELKTLSVCNNHLASRQLSLAVPVTWLRNQFTQNEDGSAEDEIGAVVLTLEPDGRLALSKKEQA